MYEHLRTFTNIYEHIQNLSQDFGILSYLVYFGFVYLYDIGAQFMEGVLVSGMVRIDLSYDRSIQLLYL